LPVCQDFLYKIIKNNEKVAILNDLW